MLKQGETTHMQIMQMLKTILKPKYSVIATLTMVGVVASVMGLAPTHGATNTLAQDCANPRPTPTFNYWPVTYDSPNTTGNPTPFCHDFAAIDAAIDNNDPQWSKSQADWENGLTIGAGQQGAVGLYLHNGAANNLPLSQTTAKNVHIITRTDTTVGASHTVSVTYTADNADPFTKSFTIHTPANSQLQVIPNTGFIYDYQGRVVLDHQNLNLGNSDYRLGDLDACFEYSLFLTYKFKVITPQTPTNPSLSITKSVRNLTRDTTDRGIVPYTASVNANRGDKVGYKILVTNTSSTVARNVTVSDNGASGITVDPGSTTVGVSDDALLTNNLWQGVIPGTINIGDLQPGESRIIKYTAHTSNNCTTLVNRATAAAEGVTPVSATASVVVENCGGTNTTHPNISITKKVKNNSNSGSYTESVNVRNGDRVNFKVTVSNTGNATLNNVVMTDAIPSGLRFDDSVTGDGTNRSFNNTTFSVDFGSISAGSSKTIEFAAIVTASGSNTICNTARATASNVNSVQDDACVTLTSGSTSHNGSPNIVLSKRAFNDTKNVDATSTSAARGDYITYTLVTTNNGDATANNYVIRDDLSQVLPLADIVSTNGGNISGNVISYPAVNIRAGETVTKTFQVRIKQSLSTNLAYQMTNTYGNTVTIYIPGTAVYVAPKTGAAGTSAVAFAGLVTAGFVIARKRNSIFKFIFA